ncbi:hypothetical protein OIU85_017964 [Salix viminalis]|uniref:Uncharacterized protein n=1 Tax=Salix viminalis TaxID=40686 RepID=A0A9Q0USQ4_SALVM|nr:hypothetical protein OIU85_017964 [Salix viminalis]
MVRATKQYKQGKVNKQEVSASAINTVLFFSLLYYYYLSPSLPPSSPFQKTPLKRLENHRIASFSHSIGLEILDLGVLLSMDWLCCFCPSYSKLVGGRSSSTSGSAA